MPEPGPDRFLWDEPLLSDAAARGLGRELRRARRAVGTGGTASQSDEGGTSAVVSPPRRAFWASITARNGSDGTVYSFVEVRRDPASASMPAVGGGMALTDGAREVNANTAVPTGAVVWMVPSPNGSQLYDFEYDAAGGIGLLVQLDDGSSYVAGVGSLELHAPTWLLDSPAAGGARERLNWAPASLILPVGAAASAGSAEQAARADHVHQLLLPVTSGPGGAAPPPGAGATVSIVGGNLVVNYGGVTLTYCPCATGSGTGTGTGTGTGSGSGAGSGTGSGGGPGVATPCCPFDSVPRTLTVTFSGGVTGSYALHWVSGFLWQALNAGPLCGTSLSSINFQCLTAGGSSQWVLTITGDAAGCQTGQTSVTSASCGPFSATFAALLTTLPGCCNGLSISATVTP
jgi:hypothetical protein